MTMMKTQKLFTLLLLLISSCLCIEAETITFTINASNGTFSGNSGSGSLYTTWTSTATLPQLTLSASARNILVSGETYGLTPGSTGSSTTYTLKVSDGYVITGYSINGVAQGDAAMTFTPSGGTATIFTVDEAQKTAAVSSLASQSASFTVAGKNVTTGANNITGTITVTVEKGSIVTYSLATKISNTVYTKTVTNKIGTALAVPLSMQRGFCNYTFQDANGAAITTVPSGDCTVYVNYSLKSSAPFEFTSDATNPAYYYMRLNTVTGGAKYYYASQASSAPYSLSDTAPSGNPDASNWAFVGDPYDVKIINKVTGAASYLSIDGTLASVSSTTSSATGNLVMSSSSTANTW
jgi:hypothetical protein